MNKTIYVFVLKKMEFERVSLRIGLVHAYSKSSNLFYPETKAHIHLLITYIYLLIYGSTC